MKLIRNHIISKALCVLMAFHIFNCSVDMPDAQPDSIAEDLSFNDMESVVEIVLEECLNIKDAVAEHDEPDDDLPMDVKLAKSFYFQNSYPGFLISIEKNIENSVPSYKEIFFNEYITDILSPPPQA